jgi:hypothetical protein
MMYCNRNDPTISRLRKSSNKFWVQIMSLIYPLFLLFLLLPLSLIQSRQKHTIISREK